MYNAFFLWSLWTFTFSTARSLIQTNPIQSTCDSLWVSSLSLAHGWVGGGCGRHGRREGKAGRAEVIHVGRAHRESNLSTFRSAKGTKFSNFKASNESVVGHRQYCDRQWINLLAEAFPSADVSMNFSGKLPNVLLLVLLAAQGKQSDPRRAAEPFRVGLLHGAGVTLLSSYLGHMGVLL